MSPVFSPWLPEGPKGFLRLSRCLCGVKEGRSQTLEGVPGEDVLRGPLLPDGLIPELQDAPKVLEALRAHLEGL